MKTLDDLLAEGVTGRRVLVRADLNVPARQAEPGVITDDGRIRAVLPTLTALRDAGARVMVMSHLGRPKGAPDPKYSLAPVAARLAELLGTPVAFATDTVGRAAPGRGGRPGRRRRRAAGEPALQPGRDQQGRRPSGRRSPRQLAAFGDAYVDDAFGAVHRKHASVYDVPALLPHVRRRAGAARGSRCCAR